MDQTEHFHFIAAAGLASGKRPRLHMAKATTSGTCIGPMPLPDWKKPSETWSMTFGDKKVIYGDARILPSGRPECDAELVGSGAQRVGHVRKVSDIEPVSYNGLHRHVLEELINQVGAKNKVRCIIDLTATEPSLALLALEWKIPYLGIVMGDFHLQAIKRQLVSLVFQKFQDPKSDLHLPELVTLTQAPPASTTTTNTGQAAGSGTTEEEGQQTTEPKEPMKKKARTAAKNEGKDLRAALLSQLSKGGEPNVGDD